MNRPERRRLEKEAAKQGIPPQELINKVIVSSPEYQQNERYIRAITENNRNTKELYRKIMGNDMPESAEGCKPGISLMDELDEELAQDPDKLFELIQELKGIMPDGYAVIPVKSLFAMSQHHKAMFDGLQGMTEYVQTIDEPETKEVGNPLEYPYDCVGELRPENYVSETLAAMLKWLDTMSQLFLKADSLVTYLDDKNSILVHQIELEDSNDNRLMELVRQLKANRLDRRHAKGVTWTLYKLVDVLNSHDAKKFIGQLHNALSATRKSEQSKAAATFTGKCPEEKVEILHKEILFGLTNSSGTVK